MEELIVNNLGLIFFLVLLVLGYGAGSTAERIHYASIKKREAAMVRIPVVTGEEDFVPDEDVRRVVMVTGSAVISIDYFKRLLANLRNVFGGRVKAYESLLDRARREAILRMKEEARKRSADIVVNVRLETASIGKTANQKGKLGSVEAVAYGTGVQLQKS